MESVRASVHNVLDGPENTDTHTPTSSKTGSRWPIPPPGRALRSSPPQSIVLQREAATIRFYSEPQPTLPRPQSFAPQLQVAGGGTDLFFFTASGFCIKLSLLKSKSPSTSFAPFEGYAETEVSWDKLHPKRTRDQLIWRLYGIVATVPAFHLCSGHSCPRDHA